MGYMRSRAAKAPEIYPAPPYGGAVRPTGTHQAARHAFAARHPLAWPIRVQFAATALPCPLHLPVFHRNSSGNRRLSGGKERFSSGTKRRQWQTRPSWQSLQPVGFDAAPRCAQLRSMPSRSWTPSVLPFFVHVCDSRGYSRSWTISRQRLTVPLSL